MGVVRDSAGNLYGATSSGGIQTCNYGNGCGVLYEVDAAGNYTVLHTFTGAANDGGSGLLILGGPGILYGLGGPGVAGGGLLYKLALQ